VVLNTTLLKSPPTTVPVFGSVKEAAFKVLVVPLVRVPQVSPPSVVFMITPLTPTAYPVFAPAKESPLSDEPRN
jgi:hypothetical protein